MAARVATLRELETWWSVQDILDMNDTLDALEAAKGGNPS